MLLTIFNETWEFAILVEELLKVLYAAFVGAIIGYEREIKSKPAGFLTFTLVCVGSCIIAILQQNITLSNIEMVTNNPNLVEVLKIDQGRIIAQVVSGIGFLGAGSIIHNKGNIKGITTAAMLWLVASLGITIGSGGAFNYILVAFTTVVIFPISLYSRKIGDKISQTHKVRRISIVFDETYEKNMFDFLASLGVIVRKTFLTNKFVADDIHLKESIIYFSLPKSKSFEEVLNKVSNLEYVREMAEA